MGYYLSMMNMTFVGLMFWYTTAGPNIRPYLPWVSFWIFAALIATVVVTVMILDYKFVYPSRQGFLNLQATRHPNPAMDELRIIRKKLERLEKRFGIDEDD